MAEAISLCEEITGNAFRWNIAKKTVEEITSVDQRLNPFQEPIGVENPLRCARNPSRNL